MLRIRPVSDHYQRVVMLCHALTICLSLSGKLQAAEIRKVSDGLLRARFIADWF